MNWKDLEEAERENFSMLRNELVSCCKECGARVSASDEKLLKKKRRYHANLHLFCDVHVQTLLRERFGDGISERLKERLDRQVETLARELHHEFQLYLRFILDKEQIWSRLKVGQKGSLEYRVKQEWQYLSDEEKNSFSKIATDYVGSLFPEFLPVEASPDILAGVENYNKK